MLLSSFLTKISTNNAHVVGQFATSSSSLKSLHLIDNTDILSTSITSTTAIMTNNVLEKASSLLLNYGFTKPWWEDDLPNILGINPLEAAIIFGALYYLYGIDALYDFARDAGKTFSTVTPIIKQVVGDIYDEFKDYLEENQERENLRKAGLDIDNLPRTTTNIIERFIDNYNTYEESLKTDNESSSSSSSSNDNIDRTVDSSFMSNTDTDSGSGSGSGNSVIVGTVEEKRLKISKSKKRLTKKEMLRDKKANTATTTTKEGSSSSSSSVNPSDLNSFYPSNTSTNELGLDSHMNLMMQEKKMESSEGDDVMLQSMKYATIYNNNDNDSSIGNDGDNEFDEFDNKMFPTASTSTSTDIPLGLEDLNLDTTTDMSSGSDFDPTTTTSGSTPTTVVARDDSTASNRFLQQISGQWNSDVLKMEQDATTVSSSSSNNNNSENTSFGFDDFNSEFDEIANPNHNLDTYTDNNDANGLDASDFGLDMSRFDPKFDLDNGLDNGSSDIVPDVDVDLNHPFPIMVTDVNTNNNSSSNSSSGSGGSGNNNKGVYVNFNYNATTTSTVSGSEIKDMLVKLDEIDREYKMLRTKLMTIIENIEQ